jgi:signal peptidase I
MTSATSSLSPGSPDTPAGSARLRVARRVADALWNGVIPALLAIVAVRYLVPTASPKLGPFELLTRAAQSFPLVLGSGLFVVFALVVRYWRAHLAVPPELPIETVAAPALPSPQLGLRQMAFSALGLALALGFVLVAREKLGEPYRVLTASMLPTLNPGAQVIGNKLAYKPGQLPKRGEVIVLRTADVPLNEPAAPRFFVKRVIGLPGDRIQMHGGLAYINGWPVPTCDAGEYVYLVPDGQGGAIGGRLLVEFLGEQVYLTVHMATKAFLDTYEVKPGEVFVLGDNRSNSLDSRSWNRGHGAGAPLSAIAARVDRFLVGTHLDGRADWRRTFRPVDPSTPRLWVEGYDLTPIDAGIAKCLKERPKVTNPPPPGGPLLPTPAAMGGGL